MATISAWCEMLDNFLGELQKAFPNESGVNKYKTSYELVRKVNPRKCVESFVAACTPYSDKIMQKDSTFFVEHSENISFLKDLNIREHWTNPKVADGTREAIWQFIQTLFIMGTTITSIPSETLGMLETVSQQCVEQMQQEGGGGDLNPTKILGNMSGLLSSLGGMLQDKKTE